MCAGCGILQNGQDWTESFGTDISTSHQRLAERRKRIALVNQLLAPCHLKLREQGRQLILSNATGKSVIIHSLPHVWREADKLSHIPANPLIF